MVEYVNYLVNNRISPIQLGFSKNKWVFIDVDSKDN